ncbi:MAG: preprotein translocase subunit YajC [Oscillospiraceae bacterium]|nr:preprotein translocase subunit YajC [Oscillospiraceae bacterium]
MDQNVMTIVMLVIMLAVFYFMLIRPENKRKKAAEKMRSELAVGDVITTIGGIVGTICAVKESNIVIESGADRVRIELKKWAVSGKGDQATENAQ